MPRSPRGTAPRRSQHKEQEHADHTRELVIDETIRCIHEEGFAAASTPHIIERACVSTGVVPYHFEDRDGLLLTAVIAYAVDALVTSTNDLDDAVDGIDVTHQRMTPLADSLEDVRQPGDHDRHGDTDRYPTISIHSGNRAAHQSPIRP